MQPLTVRLGKQFRPPNDIIVVLVLLPTFGLWSPCVMRPSAFPLCVLIGELAEYTRFHQLALSISIWEVQFLTARREIEWRAGCLLAVGYQRRRSIHSGPLIEARCPPDQMWHMRCQAEIGNTEIPWDIICMVAHCPKVLGMTLEIPTL